MADEVSGYRQSGTRITTMNASSPRKERHRHPVDQFFSIKCPLLIEQFEP
jgi:hypothetical protein